MEAATSTAPEVPERDPQEEWGDYVRRLSRSGFPAQQIAARTGLGVATVESLTRAVDDDDEPNGETAEPEAEETAAPPADESTNGTAKNGDSPLSMEAAEELLAKAMQEMGTAVTTQADLAHHVGWQPQRAANWLERLAKERGTFKKERGKRVPQSGGRSSQLWRLTSKTPPKDRKPREGDSKGARARRVRAVAQTERERDRERAPASALQEALADVADRTQAESTVGNEGALLGQLKDVARAKGAGEWSAVSYGLREIAATAIAWSVRIDRAEGEDPTPQAEMVATAATEPADAEVVDEPTRSLRARYGAVLLEKATADLDGAEARAILDRMLGLGL